MRPAKKQRPAEGGQLGRALAWLNSYSRCSRWMERYDIDALLEEGGGICKISGFLPDFVAEGALQILESLPPARWNDTAAEEDYTHNNISHRFWSVKAAPGNTPAGDADGSGGGTPADAGLEALLRAFSLLAPEQYNAFSAARYERDHHIAPHDDRAYTPVRLDSGEVVSCSRDLTCVYYLTKDWTEAMGGAFVDLEADPLEEGQQASDSEEGQGEGEPSRARGNADRRASGSGRQLSPVAQQRLRVYVPEFNSAVFFRVPRYHSVTPLRTDRPRYSVFGWYLQPGQLYELFTGQEEHPEQQRAYRQRQRATAAAGQLLLQIEQDSGGGSTQQGAEAQWGEQGQSPEEEIEPAVGADKPIAPQQCKLAQRLLARAAAKRARKQQQAGA